jgi:KUP system potassium uptake protein
MVARVHGREYLRQATEPIEDSREAAAAAPRGKRLMVLSLTALGIVYGDIGTSPLYAVRECFYGSHGVGVTPDNILGVLSLIFWALVIVVTVKYHVYIIRADNHGEGGILALMALVRAKVAGRAQWLVVVLGLFGASLLYADGVLTPAISVLGAVEGLVVINPLFSEYVASVSVAILIGLFLFQRRGTAGVGAVFGPVTLVWFSTIAVLGIGGIIENPGVLLAVNPLHAVHFFLDNGLGGFLVLGAVFLVATGGEALYADLGHFGERPIQIDWFCLVGPSLLLNYFGQGALLLSHPEAAPNPFYLLAPAWGRYPLLILATLAAIIASQAIISGAFSLTRQAVQLGYLPRLTIIHTSPTDIGQIYVPAINWALMVVTIWVVINFRSSSDVAGAYGVALTMTMLITTLLSFVVARRLWGWNLWLATAVTATFLAADVSFFAATIVKIFAGGWFPILIGAIVFMLMTTWRRGRQILAQRLQSGQLPLPDFVLDLQASDLPRVKGMAVFMTGNTDGTPQTLLHHIKHNRMLHERVVLVTVVTEEIPHVPPAQRLEFTALGGNVFRVIGHYGFMEDPDVPALLEGCAQYGLDFDPMMSSYFLGHETLVTTKRPGMHMWREQLFAFMSRNALRATTYFRIPPNRVVELGAMVEL